MVIRGSNKLDSLLWKVKLGCECQLIFLPFDIELV